MALAVAACCGCLYASDRYAPFLGIRGTSASARATASNDGSGSYVRTNDKFDSTLPTGETVRWPAGLTVRLVGCSETLCRISSVDQNGRTIAARVNKKVLDF
jgi:hypothetical protein